MSSKRRSRTRFFQTLYFRFAALFFLTMIIAAGVLFGGTFFTLYRSLVREDTIYSQRRLLAYWARYQAGGIDGLVEDLRAETLIYDERPFFVRVARRGDNTTLFLSYPEHWENFDIRRDLEEHTLEEFENEIRLRNPDTGYELEVSTTLLDEEYLVQVGMSSERREAFLRLYQRNALLFLGFALLLGLTAGLFIADRAVAPLRRLSATLSSIVRTGNLSDRMPVRGTGDELDEMGGLFNRMLERIQGLISRMRETLDTVAHDLRTPMTRLRGGAELALQRGGAESMREALSDALEESDHILTMLNSLMDISEAESGILKLALKPVDPRQTLLRVADVYQFVADEREIAITIEGVFPDTIPADPTRFSQVAGNLVDNAVKYSPRGGTVTVRGAVETIDAARFFRLRVLNEGPPIRTAEMERIWERLYRAADNSRPGMGLGLSLVKAITEAHGGTASAGNLPGGGVEFSVTFPISP